jgi:hypothetical protein
MVAVMKNPVRAIDLPRINMETRYMAKPVTNVCIKKSSIFRVAYPIAITISAKIVARIIGFISNLL